MVTTRLDEATLRSVAERPGAGSSGSRRGSRPSKTWWTRSPAGEGDEMDSREITQYEEQFQLFLMLGFVLLFAEALVPERRKTAKPGVGGSNEKNLLRLTWLDPGCPDPATRIRFRPAGPGRGQ